MYIYVYCYYYPVLTNLNLQHYYASILEIFCNIHVFTVTFNKKKKQKKTCTKHLKVGVYNVNNANEKKMFSDLHIL